MTDTSSVLALLARARALLEPLADPDQMPADREAVIEELGRTLDRIEHDLAGLVEVPGHAGAGRGPGGLSGQQLDDEPAGEADQRGGADQHPQQHGDFDELPVLMARRLTDHGYPPSPGTERTGPWYAGRCGAVEMGWYDATGRGDWWPVKPDPCSTAQPADLVERLALTAADMIRAERPDLEYDVPRPRGLTLELRVANGGAAIEGTCWVERRAKPTRGERG